MSMKLTPISSSQNEVFRSALASLDGSGDYVLVHGLKLASEIVSKHSAEFNAKSAIRGYAVELKTLIARASFKLSDSEMARDLFSKRFENPVTRIVLDDELFDQLDPFGVPDAIAVFKKPARTKWAPETNTGETHLLLATQNPSNLGACLRSAAAFGIQKVVLLKEASSAFHAKAIRGSMGAVFQLSIFEGPSIRDLKSTKGLDGRLVALDLNGEPLSKFNWPHAPLILVGEEGLGVPKDLQAARVTIPILPSVDSLNASVSCGIALFTHRMRDGDGL